MAQTSELIAIGASAGGLDPLQAFFDATPDDSGFAFVVVQHLSPDHPSLMDELLSRHTTMPVRRIEDGMLIEANTVYVIPPKTLMRVKGGHLTLTEQERKREKPPTPIDVFFESVALEFGNRGAAVVLSGTGSDGSRGIQAVHAAGGRTVAQDTTAKFDGMPRAAIDTSVIDMILPPGEMPGYLLGDEDTETGRPTLVISDPPLADVMETLNQRFGLDFSRYKITTVARRIERRVQLLGLRSITDYVDRLRDDGEEQDRVYRDLLIGVTRFFRDTEAFEVLRSQVIPRLVRRRQETDEPIRVWIAACASGEEAYSIAMLLDDAARRANAPSDARIFATDAHRGSIDAASTGRFSQEAMEAVSPEFRERYFRYAGDDMQVTPELRSMITFAPHNLLSDAPFTRIDLCVCRNMLIYLKPAAQERVIGLLHFALRVDGVLMLGSSESPGRFHAEFTNIDTHWRMYAKRRHTRLLTDSDIAKLAPRSDRSAISTTVLPKPTVVLDDRIQRAYDVILADVLPAGMLLNDRREIVHVFGRARELLSPPEGRMSLDVLEMVPADLRTPIGSAIVRATREQREFSYGGISLPDDDTSRHVLTATPILVSGDGPPYVLITIRPDAVATVPGGPHTPSSDAQDYAGDELSIQKIAALEHELGYTKENLQATVEEMETTNEELNATNEELIASNEELQSTNEELQSVNEELHTVNAEHQQKITQLVKLSDDMQNLMSSSNIGTLFLDPDLAIRFFTPAVCQHFRIREQDLGRPLEEITSHLKMEDLLERARRVYETGEAEEFETTGAKSAQLLIAVRPYTTGKGVVDGVVISVVDLTTLKSAERRATVLAEQNQLILDHIPAMVWYKDRDCRVVRTNQAAAAATGLSIEEIEGKHTRELHPEEASRYIADDLEVLGSGKPKLGIMEPFQGRDGIMKWIRTDKVPLHNDSGETTGLLTVTTDISELKQAESRLQSIKQRLEMSLEAAGQGTWDWDIASDAATVDSAWLGVLGYAPGELSVTSGAEWAELIHPEDRSGVWGSLERASKRAGGKFDSLYRIRAKDGAWLWVQSIGAVVEEHDGKPVRMSGTIADVHALTTSRIELERINRELESLVAERTRELNDYRMRLERAIEGSNKGIWEWEVDSEECWFADHFWALLGYENGDRPPDRLESINERIHPDDLEPTWDDVRVCLDGGRPLDRNYRLQSRKGDYRWFRVIGNTSTDPATGRSLLSGSIIDIHEEVVAKDELEATKRELEARVASRTNELSQNVTALADRNEQLDQFAHVASHDLRAPLRSIAGNAELAMLADDPDGATGYIDKVLSGARRMSDLIDSLAAYSQVGRAEIRFADVDLDDVIGGIRADLDSDLRRRNGSIEAEPLGSVYADKRLIGQVLLNIIGNGLKFTRDERPRVVVSRIERDGEAVIRIADNGIGLDPGYASEVFEPFKRLSDSREFAGSGVGLSVCKRIVERHGGEIWYEAGDNGGAVFCFSLPNRNDEPGT
ncbi:MAG: chemotaxis protein CheB [Planctomycetota bacterium]